MAELTNDEKLDLQATLADWLDRHDLCSGTVGNLDEGIDVVMTWEQVRRAVGLLEGKVLVDREMLQEALHCGNDHGDWCGWPGCAGPWPGRPEEHSDACPLRGEW